MWKTPWVMFFSNVCLLRPFMGAKVENSQWKHLVDFCPELFEAIDCLSPFLADQSASQGWLQIYAAQDDLSSFMTLRKEIPPVLSAWALSKVQALHFSFHFWRHVSKWFLKDWPWHPDFSVIFQFDFQEGVFLTGFLVPSECFAWMIWKEVKIVRTILRNR